MSTKTTFKRIALVAVAALGLGVLSVVPARAVTDEVLTLSASSASINVGETATVTITNSFTSNTGANGPDSSVVYVAGADSGATVYAKLTTDSANVATNTSPERTVTLGSWTDSAVASVGGSYTKQTITLKFHKATTAGTYIYTISTRDKANTVINKTATFTLTVVAEDTTAVASKSLLWIQQTDTFTTGVTAPRSDSAVVASAGLAATPVMVGVVYPEFRNASDTTTGVAGTAVSGSVVLTVSGPGLLSKAGTNTLAKSITLTSTSDTAVVWSDGTAGVGTLTGSISGVYLTQAAKSVTYGGKAVSFTATVESTTVVSTSATAAGAITFVAKDSAGNAVKSAALQGTGYPLGFYALVSDTKVVGGTAANASASPAWTACSYVTARAKWVCDIPVIDSGTATITIGDSKTVSTSAVTSSALTLKVAGAAWTGTISADKSTYAPGEKAIITLTAKDSNGNAVADGAATAQFASAKWGTLVPAFSGAGSTFTSLENYLAGTTFVGGVDTAVVYMPTTAGTYTWSATTNGSNATPVSFSFSVVDPTKDAADAATDAALEATDAAYAAQDAAQLAAEAADAATAAAEAATAAVEDLATQVASLFADLQKQITTLANVVAKIAKKVKA